MLPAGDAPDPQVGLAVGQHGAQVLALMELVHRNERPPLAIVQPGVTARQHLARVERLKARLAQLPDPDSTLVPGYGKARAHENEWEPRNRFLNRHRERWKERLGDPSFHLRKLRSAHGSGIDEIGNAYSVVRNALGHARTSGETPRYLLAKARAVSAAKQRLATHLLPPAAPGHVEGQGAPSAAAGDAPQP